MVILHNLSIMSHVLPSTQCSDALPSPAPFRNVELFPQLLGVLLPDSPQLSTVFRNLSGWKEPPAQRQNSPSLGRLQPMTNQFRANLLIPTWGDSKRPFQLKISLGEKQRFQLSLRDCKAVNTSLILLPPLPYIPQVLTLPALLNTTPKYDLHLHLQVCYWETQSEITSYSISKTLS